MKINQNPEKFYRIHVFCCINARGNPLNSSCCAGKGLENGEDSISMHKYFAAKCKELGVLDVRINTSGCLGRCKLGKVMVIYPEAIWYHYDNKKDIDEIIDDHIIGGRSVQRLMLSNSQMSL